MKQRLNSIKKPLEINLDKVVVGSSLEALLYAFYGKYKLIYTRLSKPDDLEELEDFGLGKQKKSAWEKIWFQLGMAGYIPYGDKVKHIRYVDANTIKAVTHEEAVTTVKFNKLYVFDDHEFLDIPPSLSRTSDKVKIVDWLKTTHGESHDYDIIENDSDFMKKIIFFEGVKRRTAKKKDICVISYTKIKNIDKTPEYLVKIKTEALVRDIELKIHNKSNVKIDHIKRDIVEYGQNIYENFDNVEFVYDTAKFIFDTNDRRRIKIDYMKYIRLKLGLK